MKSPVGSGSVIDIMHICLFQVVKLKDDKSIFRLHLLELLILAELSFDPTFISSGKCQLRFSGLRCLFTILRVTVV